MKIPAAQTDNSATVVNEYLDTGFSKISGFLSAEQIGIYDSIITTFHQQWLADNSDYYEKGVVNSAYITSNKPPVRISDEQRQVLFQLIASNKLTDLIEPLFEHDFRFMNTQVFFNPKKLTQNNYWHRDGQYHLSLNEQQQALTNSTVLHCRIALRDEPGIELVPRSHVDWDSQHELAVRLETDGCHKHDQLDNGQVIPLKAGDLLIFSANMIHRGLYCGDILALDILYCDAQQPLLSHRRDDCLPETKQLKLFERGCVFGSRKEKGSV